MRGFLIALVILAALAVVMARVLKRGFDVRNAEGRRVTGVAPGQLGTIAASVAGLVLVIASVRVVPVGHALVIFNTITRSFRLSPQGVTLVWPLISQTQQYDLRRLEYTMSATTGEGRRAAVDDSLWSPTQEGL
jgi:regulator of protease activity HflC (stomatin/prohibitin superfamily)